MSAISHEPIRPARDKPRLLDVVVRETWTSIAISVIWLAVLFDAVFGPNIVNRSAGGDWSSVPSAVVVALFAFLATWVVARHGFRERDR